MTFTARMKLLGLGTSLGLLASLGGVQAQETIKLGLSVPLSGSGAIWGKGSEFMCKKAAQEIAHEAAALIAGTNDLAADLRLPRGAGRGPLQMALQSIVLAARAAGIAVFDGVFNSLEDEDGFAAEAAEGAVLPPATAEPQREAAS